MTAILKPVDYAPKSDFVKSMLSHLTKSPPIQIQNAKNTKKYKVSVSLLQIPFTVAHPTCLCHQNSFSKSDFWCCITTLLQWLICIHERLYIL